MTPSDSILLDLPGFKIVEVSATRPLVLKVEYEPKSQCPRCGAMDLRLKDSFLRRIRHVLIGQRPTWLEVMGKKYQCRVCCKYFNTRFEGIKPYRRTTEQGRREISKLHHKGWDQKSLSERRIGSF